MRLRPAQVQNLSEPSEPPLVYGVNRDNCPPPPAVLCRHDAAIANRRCPVAKRRRSCRVTYALQQAMRAIRGNWVASVSTITTMTLSLTILAGFSLISLNLNTVLANLQDELQVSAFLLDRANPARLVQEPRAWPEVDERRVYYVRKEEALGGRTSALPALQQAASLVHN